MIHYFNHVIVDICFFFFQLYAMPVFDMIETMLVKKLRFKPTRLLRFIVRNVYVGEYIFEIELSIYLHMKSQNYWMMID
jgi:hypothetical protein